MSTERIRGLTEAYNKIIGESLKENLNEDTKSTQPTSAGANPQFGRPYLNARPKPMLDGVKTMQGTKTLPAPQRPSLESKPSQVPHPTQGQQVDPKAEIDGLKNQIQILKLKQQVDALKKPTPTERTAADPNAPKRMGRDIPKTQKEHHQKDENGNTIPHDDVFDIAKNQLVEEGHSEEEALSLMSSWTPEQINELRELIENILTPSSSADDVESKYNKLFDAQRKKTSQYGEPWIRPTSPSDSKSNIVPKKPGLHRGEEPIRPPKSPGGSVNRPVSRPEPSRPVSRPEPSRPVSRPPELKRPLPKR